jgi:ABC-type antimicrobial peptide transport system permease subunit
MLAAVGLYGVVAYSAAARRTEIGVRLALGATRRRIVRMMLGDVARMLVGGVGAGAVAAISLGSLIGSLLFGLDGRDPGTLGVSIVLLIGAAIGSALVAAWRAARVDPLIALRD